MNLFVNDIPVTILKPGREVKPADFNHTVDARKAPITRATLINHVLVVRASAAHLDNILDLVNSKVPISLLSLVVSVENYDEIKLYLKGKFKIVKAAGGLVRKKERSLMIYRMKKWDLPKGKKEPGEGWKEAAAREVTEECNVKVKTGRKICTTWHTYTMNKNAMLKKTRWYNMDLADDSHMKPAGEEDIEDVRWMTQKEVYHALENSYRSIRFVFEEFYRKEEAVK
jgi:ADP-ribose pyrophosphatase YjhB (NUDIX family)